MLADWPGLMAAGAVAVTLKSSPVPLRFNVCVDGLALSLSVSVAVRGFVVPDGVNVMAIVQVAFACMTAPLVHVVPVPAWIAKSVLGVPLVPMIEGAAERVSAELPVFLTITVWAVLVVVTSWPLNVSGVEGEVIVTIGVERDAIPDKATN